MKKGFTLVELLVVIAIMAVLLTLITPALQTARKQAQGAVCLANVSGLSKAWYEYANDNDGRIVGGNTGLTETKQHGYSWACWPQTDVGVDKMWGSTVEEKLHGIRRGLLWDYVQDEDAYHCPGDRRYLSPPASSGFGGMGGYRSYSIAGGMNGIHGPGSDGANDWDNIVAYKKLSRIKSPSDKFVFIEESDGRGFNAGAWVVNTTGNRWVDPLAIWHNGSSILGFADSHAERHIWMDQDTLDMAEGQIIFYMTSGDSVDLKYVQQSYGFEGMIY